MSKAWSTTTAIAAVMGIAPWAVFLGGLAKLTDVLTDFNLSQALKQTVIMLEWYILSAQLAVLLLAVIIAAGNGLRRAHTLLNMFLAVNTALLILRATVRLWQINRYQDGEEVGPLLGVANISGNPLPYLRALAAGLVSTATWNFVLAIVVGLAGTTALPEHVKASHYKPGAPIAA
ncbi:hypothetical protein GPECTOR_11g54 [Gonium pectorale]|uniref:DUF4149 domain-containing protein n=1 Tax=Gonium pectorale TaxID=33097 RepID=A0A150GQA8_GONPE|nr:hypothetical protein GPECTOR_11g54 [Gonium pectorale]|eukprot:KXZ51928.1 hypothetical protein GPECTOR_11g54 [Gonium pectorale]